MNDKSSLEKKRGKAPKIATSWLGNWLSSGTSRAGYLARKAGFKIYQIPVRLIHFESRDNKIIKANDANKIKAEIPIIKNVILNPSLIKTNINPRKTIAVPRSG